MVSAINYEPRGVVPLEASGHMNAQTSRFRQLEVWSDLVKLPCTPGSLLICVQAAARVCIFMHIVTIVRAERTLTI